MATFNVNQVRHFYVAKSFNETLADLASVNIVGAAGKFLHLEQKTSGGVVASDLIDVNKVKYAKKTTADSMKRGLITKRVELSADVNSGNVIPGEDYLLRLTVRNYLSLSDDSFYTKHGVVRGVRGMTASDFYMAMANSLLLNFGREDKTLFNFYLIDDTDARVPVTAKITTGTYKALEVEEAEQDWIRGTKQSDPVNFDMQAATVLDTDGLELVWGNVTKEPAVAFVKNGKKICDMEYFYKGDRGDIYRGVGFPNAIPGEYFGDPAVEYTTIDVHYYYEGDNESPQKSEKTLTIACPSSAIADQIATKMETLGITVE